MSSPTRIELESLQFSLDGSPWCRVTASNAINPDTLEYSLDGSPWWGMGEGTPVAGHIKRACGIGRENIKKIGGINIENVKMAGGVVD